LILQKAVLLDLLKVRVIANGNRIYELNVTRPVVISEPIAQSIIIITDGYHYTRPMLLEGRSQPVSYYSVMCTIDDNRLLAGSIITALLYAIGYTSGLLIVQVCSFVPLLMLLYIYYLNKRTFIRVKSVRF
jgi:fumarate hydratase class II